LYKAGLAYRREAPVNWCPSCKTVLANEQVISGKCERCETQVVQKNLKQWFFKITDYAEKLLEGHKKLNWPEKTILMQKNWIGKSEGAEIVFLLKHANNDANKYEYHANAEDALKVFTTRPDTLFGTTFMVVAPEHPLVASLLKIQNPKTCSELDSESKIQNMEEIERYVESARKKSELQRTDLAKEKTGVELKGIKAVNPVNGKEIPIFVADYVLMNYGSGAIMAVPAHDERDFEFAKKYNLPIIEVVKPIDNQQITNNQDTITKKISNSKYQIPKCFEGEGVNIASFIFKWFKNKRSNRKNYNLDRRKRYWQKNNQLSFT